MTRLRWYSTVGSLIAILSGLTLLAMSYPRVAGPIILFVTFVAAVEIVFMMEPDYED